ncbi:MAG: aminotransferase class V-fold PLP-dependent enzyme [Planctomycetota bacterium]|jgi:cysteine desulfurase|nr:aminotransferase class V-fold PLP-dependent enzyme [Planctomycetota bacterium]
MSAYLDWNASAPLAACAREAWLEAAAVIGNPAAVHRCGQQARHHWDALMQRASQALHTRRHELVATSGGTEANATAIYAALAGGGHAVASCIEHSSVLRNLERWAAVRSLVAVDDCGRIDLDALGQALQADTRLVCLQFANNELGVLQDVPEVVAMVRARAPNARILLDCCQGGGKHAINLTALGVDFASFAGHKFGAPRGCGLLYVRTGVPFPALLAGGRQQDDRRSGSQDLAGLAALVAALEDGVAQAETRDAAQAQALEAVFEQIAVSLPQAQWIARDAKRLGCTLSLAHPGIDNEVLVARLDLAGFAVSRGAACMARSGEPSHVIAALGLDPSVAGGVIRISIGPSTTPDELAAFAAAYVREVQAMVSP